jgi:hypothetical protein
MNEWGESLGIGAPAQPFVQLSGSTLVGGRFTVEANLLPTYDYSLWRSRSVGGPWQQVTGAAQEVEQFSLRIVDDELSSSQFIYRVEARTTVPLQ